MDPRSRSEKARKRIRPREGVAVFVKALTQWDYFNQKSVHERQQQLRNVLPLMIGQAQAIPQDLRALLLYHTRLPQNMFDVELVSPHGTGQKTWLSSTLGLANFLPGFFVGMLVGLVIELPKGNKRLPAKEQTKEKKRPAEIRGGVRRGTKTAVASRPSSASPASIEGGGELKMVLVVRLDLKMKSGKIASQCAHAAVGTFEECLSRGQKYLLKKWEDCGQPKIVVTCNSQNEMNELRARAENAGLPVFTVADAGRTQVAAGSQTVLAIGPGLKTTVDNVTRHLALL